MELSCPLVSVEGIKQTIDRLSFQGPCDLVAMLAPPADNDWDQGMLSDLGSGGKLDRLKEQAHKEYPRRR